MGMGIRIGLMSLLMGLALCFSSSAIAQTPAPGNTSTTNVSSKAQSVKTCQAYAGLTNRIASCVRDALQKAGSRYFDPRSGVYSYVARAITALFTLAVAIYGAMAAAGMIERPARDTFMLMIKIAMVAFFTTNLDVAYRQVIAMMDATGQAVVSFVPADGMVANSEKPPSVCMKRMIEANGTSRLAGPWLGLDCVVDTVIGIKLDDSQATGSAIANLSGGGYTSGLNKEDDKKASKARVDTINNYYNDKLKSNEQGQSRGLINFLFSSLKTSVLGFMIAIIGFIFIYGLVMLLVKSLLIYLAGYIGITVMMIVAPIFIPLVLFKQTKEYFDKWVRMLMGFALQPIIILIFVTFSIAAVDLAVYSSDYSIMYSIAGDESRKPDFSINTYLGGKQVITVEEKELFQQKFGLGSIETFESKVKGIFPYLANSDCVPSKMKTDAALKKGCSEVNAIKTSYQAMNWETLATVRQPAVTVSDGAKTPAEQISREVLASIIFAGIVVFVMNGLLTVIPSIANDLLGDFNQSPNLAKLGGSLPGLGKGRK